MNELESLFNETIELVYAVFGESAFLVAFKKRESSPPQKIVYQKELLESPPASSGEIKIRQFITPILGLKGRDRSPTVNPQAVNCPRSTVEDSLMQAFSRNLKAKNCIIQNAATIKATRYSNERLLHLKRTNRYIFDGRHGERKDVEERIKYFQELLQNYIP